MAAADIAEERRDRVLAEIDADIARLEERRAAAIRDADAAEAVRQDACARVAKHELELGSLRASVGGGGGRAARVPETPVERVVRLRAELEAIQRELGLAVGSS